MRAPSIAAGLFCAVACGPASTHVPVDARGTQDFLLLVLDARDDRLLSARRFDPSQEAFELSADGAQRVVLLGYPQPLDAYGVSERSVSATGRPLPPPARWVEVSAAGEVRVREPAEWTADALPTVRVPGPACARVEVVREAQRTVVGGRRVTFAAALDPARTLLGLRGRLDASREVSLAVATATAVSVLPIPLAWSSPRGLVEPDGAIWVVATATRSDSARRDPIMCRFGAGAPLDSRSCTRHSSEDEVLIEQAALRRTADGALFVAVTTSDDALFTWRSDDPRWRRRFTGGTSMGDCRSQPVSAVLTLDGDDTGLASFRNGNLERFRVRGDEVERTTVFRRPDGVGLCEASLGAAGVDGQLLVERSASGGLALPPARAWWRSGPAATWQPLRLMTPLATGIVAPLDDLLVVTSRSFTVLTLAPDPRRPDLPPAECETLGVSSDGTVASSHGGMLLIAGSAGGVVNDHAVTGLRRR